MFNAATIIMRKSSILSTSNFAAFLLSSTAANFHERNLKDRLVEFVTE